MGAAPFEGDLGIEALNAPIVDMASTPSHQGYWLVPSDGGVFSFDDAAFSGSLGGHALTTTVAAAMSDPAGGYRLVSSARTGVPFGAPTFPAPPGGPRSAEPACSPRDRCRRAHVEGTAGRPWAPLLPEGPAHRVLNRLAGKVFRETQDTDPRQAAR